ncbi:MAG: DUF1214 domain-containing protein [Pseudomonadota bacterium]
MKSALIWILAAILGAILGGLSALFMAGLLPVGPKLGGTVEIDGWTSDWSIGSESANPYVRARVARHGLLALRKEEAVYFTKRTDDEGERLREDCVYRVEGGAFPAEWWSITLYDAGSRLPINEDGALSFDLTSASSWIDQSSQDWTFFVSNYRLNEHVPWVSSRNAGQFDLMMRLYRPSAAVLNAPDTTLIPPTISRLSCDEEA